MWPLRMIWRAAVPIHDGSLVELGFEPEALRPKAEALLLCDLRNEGSVC
ncbi:hypothetical protein AVEN_15844-1, partial [Araneus ventricosus]